MVRCHLVSQLSDDGAGDVAALIADCHRILDRRSVEFDVGTVTSPRLKHTWCLLASRPVSLPVVICLVLIVHSLYVQVYNSVEFDVGTVTSPCRVAGDVIRLAERSITWLVIVCFISYTLKLGTVTSPRSPLVLTFTAWDSLDVPWITSASLIASLPPSSLFCRNGATYNVKIILWVSEWVS